MSVELHICPLCEGPRHEQIYLARDRHYGISGLYRIVRCFDCSLVFLNPMYSSEELAPLYPADYYAYRDNVHRSGWKDIFKRILCFRSGTRDPKFAKPGRMLDLGCGSGWYLHHMRGYGWETHGVEINDSAAALGRATWGLDIFSGTLKQAAFPADYFDYIRSNHSFEHIPDPNETLDEVRRILRPDGKILIGVPNIASLNARVFRQYWWYLGAPVHPFNYSVKTLSELLSKHDFRVQNISYNSDYGGIVGSAQIWLNRNTNRKSTEGAVVNSIVMKGLGNWAAKVADRFRVGDAIEITAVKATN